MSHQVLDNDKMAKKIFVLLKNNLFSSLVYMGWFIQAVDDFFTPSEVINALERNNYNHFYYFFII